MVEIPLFNSFYKNPILLDLFKKDSNLSSFHNGTDLSHLNHDFLEKRDLSIENREVLYQVISSQYSKTGLKIPENLKAIKNKGVFTITTGHQLCVFGGPQYFIHKIISVLKIVENLKLKFKDFDFVPLFWMASEDHDFQEISSLNIFSKNLSVMKEDGVGVGKLNPEIFTPILESLKDLFKNDLRFKNLESIFSASLSQQNWANSSRYWISKIFEKENLIVIDADDVKLKKLFLPIFKKELKEQFIYNSVENTNNKLRSLGYEPKINPRVLNLFFLEDKKRHRIIFENNVFKIGDKNLNLEEVLSLLNSSPEKFSPNVLMRPVYQELLLPNLVYVGGPSELVYWSQLKKSFEQADINFPLLILRDHFNWMSEKSYKQWKNLGFNDNDLANNPDTLIKNYILNSNNKTLDFKIEIELLDKLSQNLLDKAKGIESTLEPTVNGTIKGMMSDLEKVKNKFLKALKSKEELKKNQLKKISGQLHLNNKLNEREDSFIPMYVRNEKEYIKTLKSYSQPENKTIKIIIY
jgi:bacillithiol biosynthesis cysteine-adding enzyme BshC